MCAEIDQILQAHFGSEQKFVLVSHSYVSAIFSASLCFQIRRRGEKSYYLLVN